MMYGSCGQVMRKKCEKNMMKKGVGSGVWSESGAESGSTSQRYGSGDPDPDPHQKVTNPQRCLELKHPLRVRNVTEILFSSTQNRRNFNEKPSISSSGIIIWAKIVYPLSGGNHKALALFGWGAWSIPSASGKDILILDLSESKIN